jgi:phenylpropionate dioxygenase-like ring-hydroxylating dioxygenase large terminal subunit
MKHIRTEYPAVDEIEQALRRCWQPLLRRDDLDEGPRQVTLLGERLAVFLTASGETAVVSDRCPHRGASLSSGEVAGEALRCPYHGWEWEGGGRCLRIPSLADQRLIPASARLASYPVREQWGLIWTALDEPLGEPPRVPWPIEEWTLGHGPSFELPVAFGHMIENFRDVAHFAFVHEATLGRIAQVVEPLTVEEDGLVVRMSREMRAGEGAERSWGTLRAIAYHAAAPNFVAALLRFADGTERCLLHAARAIGTAESIHFGVVGLAPGYRELSMEEVVDVEWRLYEEDRETVSTVSPPQYPLDPTVGVNTLADAFTLAYRRAFAEFVVRAIEV